MQGKGRPTSVYGIPGDGDERKFLEKVATTKQIPLEDVVWFVEFLKRRQLENEKETSFSNEVDIRELQHRYVWKVKVMCSLCSPAKGDTKRLREPGNEGSTLGNAVANAVQRGVQSACKMKKVVVFDKLDV